jgi:hypothetical protein
LPSSWARSAAAKAVEPEPRITRSKRFIDQLPRVDLGRAARRSRIEASKSVATPT